MKSQKYKILAIIILVLSFSIFLDKMRLNTRQNVIYFNKNSTLQTSTTDTADWYRTWGGSGYDVCTDMILDDIGNIYLVGFTSSFGKGSYDMFLIKYNSSGDILFNITWGSTEADYCEGIELDDFGNIYLAGSTNSYGAGNSDMCLVKFDNTGSYLWNKTWGDIGYEFCNDIQIDDSGDIYLAGNTDSYGAGSQDMCLVKFYDSGDYVWNKTWGGSDDEICNAFDINIYDELYLGGYSNSFGIAHSMDVALVKYDYSKDFAWETIWSGNHSDNCNSLITDTSANVYLGGVTDSYGQGEDDVLVVKYDRTGNQKWNLTWGFPLVDSCLDITLDSSETLYITGYTSPNNDYLEVLVMQIDYFGNPIMYCTWKLDYHAFGAAIEVDNMNNVYVGGMIYLVYGENPVILLLKNPKSLVPNEIPGYRVDFLLTIIIVALFSIILKNTLSKKILNKKK